ncbi:MAG: cytochrome b N-terminal domain-containing protein [Betaproteobacteria bacterium]|nr:cytochrome b N-terminal domain-containing protein [Betaproteobacteria bacterium]
MPGLERLRQRGLNGWRAAERLTDSAFGSAVNPLRHLGAIGMLAFWLVSASGIVLYIAFGTSVQEAHASVEQLAAWPLATGTLLRGVHRYGTDLLIVAMAAHLVREWLYGHERGFRRYTWLTGVVPIGFVFIAGIGGYWLPWDQLAQYSALATAEWFDALPGLFATPFARNFLVGDAVDDRLFSLFVFVHIGVSLLLLFVLWFHLQRLSRTAVWPPSPVAWGLCGGLVVLSLAAPVLSHAPAQLAQVPAALRLDWFVLFVHPLVDATSAAFVWVVAGAAAVFLFGLPFFATQRRAARAPVAVVDPANCNGCRRCQADCPYAAVTMVPHPNQRIGRVLAVVDPDLCAGCGICAGSCPSSTPFRSARQLVTGIDMPQLPVGTLRQRLQTALAASRAPRPLVLFGCDHGARVDAVQADDVCTFGCLCAGQLPPSFVEYALRDGAAGVLVAPCRSGGCAFRLGDRWTHERLAGQREPHLRASVAGADGTAGGRLEIVDAGLGDEAALAAAVQQLRERVSTLAPPSPDIVDAPDAAHLPDAAPPRLHHA